MGYFGKQVGRPVTTPSKDVPSKDVPSKVVPSKDVPPTVASPTGASQVRPAPLTVATAGKQPHFAAQAGQQPTQASSQATSQTPAPSGVAAPERCPRCMGLLAEEDGWLRCGGRCGGRWVSGSVGRLLDPATLPLGVCACCRPRVPLVQAEVGAICPQSHVEYLILPEGTVARTEAAPLGICRCCLPPQPLVQVASGLVCRNKPQQHYAVVNGEVEWIGLAPAADQAAVTAAIDAALAANNAELTLFGLFATP